MTPVDNQPAQKRYLARDIAVALGIALGAIGLIAVWYFIWGPSERTLDQAETLNMDWQTIFFFLGFVGIVASGVLNYHRQLSTQDQITEAQKQSRSAQEQAEAANKQVVLAREQFEDVRLREVERSRQERYAQGAEMIAHDSAAVRMAGLNIITQLGREVDAPNEWRQTCLNLVCSYLRASSSPPESATGTEPWPHHVLSEEACRLLPTLLDDALSDGKPSPGLDVDLRGAHLVALNLQGKCVGDAQFTGVTFTGDSGFNDAKFSGAAWFGKATFIGLAGFYRATFARDADFAKATFNENMSFDKATFFGDAEFSDAISRRDAVFTDGMVCRRASVGDANFGGDSAFDGAKFNGDAWFTGVAFEGRIGFDKAEIKGDASFSKAEFNGGARFTALTVDGFAGFGQATFTGVASFDKATFKSDAEFSGAKFTKDALFDGATFTGHASLSAATFKRPPVGLSSRPVPNPQGEGGEPD